MLYIMMNTFIINFLGMILCGNLFFTFHFYNLVVKIMHVDVICVHVTNIYL